MSPGDVKDSIEQRLLGDPEPDWERARPVASDSTATAGVDVSLVPTDRGQGECIVIEHRLAGDHSGRIERGDEPTSAVLVRRSGGRLERSRIPADQAERPIRFPDRGPIGPIGDPNAAVALVGAVFPDVVSITADFGDGAEYTFNVVSADGWFAAILPGGVPTSTSVDGTLVNEVVELKLIDIEGRVVATIGAAAARPVPNCPVGSRPMRARQARATGATRVAGSRARLLVDREVGSVRLTRQERCDGKQTGPRA